MNANEIMAALGTVEQDHELVLEKIRALRTVVGLLLEPKDFDPRRVLSQLREIRDYLATQLEAHFEEEDETLFPILEQQSPNGPQLVASLRQEHDEIRRKREEFTNCLEVATELEDNLPRAVLRDLVIDGWELWSLLDHHANAETEGVQECVAQALAGHAHPPGANSRQ